MSEECPNCRQLTNTSFSRLVKDTCGHTKCRMCLLYEEQGCKTCNNEHRLLNIGNYDCSLVPKQISDDCLSDSKDITSEEIVLPLELVINKESKPKENNFDPVSVDCVNNDGARCKDDVHFEDKQEEYECSIGNCTDAAISNKLYIPEVELSGVTVNIQAQLNHNDNQIEAPQSHNGLTNNDDESKRKSDIFDKGVSPKGKQSKCPDRTHISVIPGTPERYKCNICGKVFRNKKGKCYHDACITGVKPYQCTFCDRSFVKRSHFEYHERIHSGYKPFKCGLCEKAFPQQNKLNRHMFSHSKEKQFVCPKCSKRYTKRDDLKNHLSLHNTTAVYPCKVCDKTFRILTNLKRHMRTHINERPYTCDQCNKSFKDKSLLMRHKRTHGKERPFSCADCNRVFLSKSELKRHLTVHSDEKPFSCEYCQTVFRRKDNLNRHIRHHHSEDSSLEPAKLQIVPPSPSTKLVSRTKQQTNPKQKQKPKKTQRTGLSCLPKSPAKVSVVYVSSRDQINSRLDPMGNITPVIRTTSEVSNAVPVINGPIRRPEERTDTRKKTFTYTEPIPLAEAVVINRRIEEKLYTQNVSNHNYFFRGCLTCNDKTYPTVASQALRANTFNSFSTSRNANRTVSLDNTSCQNDPEKFCSVRKECAADKEGKVKRDKAGDGQISVSDKQANCISTIKKHIVQHVQSESSKRQPVTDSRKIDDTSLPKNSDISSEKKQNNVHWRRRMTETLNTR